MYSDEINYVYLCFFKPVLIDLQRINKSFESDEADVTKKLGGLVKLIKNLISMIIPTIPPNFDPLTTSLDTILYTQEPQLGYLFDSESIKLLQQKQINEETLKGVKERCVGFLKILINQLRQRLPKNIKILERMDIFSVDKALRVIKPSLIPILEERNVSAIEIDKIERQWNSLTNFEWKNRNNTEEFWAEVSSFRDVNGGAYFEELSEIAITFLVLPISNAAVERVFSVMNLVKTKTRNRLQSEMLNSILTIKAGLQRKGKCCNDYNIPIDIVKNIGTSNIYDESNILDDLPEQLDGFRIKL